MNLQKELKEKFTQKCKFCQHVLTFKLAQNSVSLFLLIKEDILKNVCSQTVDGSHWLP